MEKLPIKCNTISFFPLFYIFYITFVFHWGSASKEYTECYFSAHFCILYSSSLTTRHHHTQRNTPRFPSNALILRSQHPWRHSPNVTPFITRTTPNSVAMSSLTAVFPEQSAPTRTPGDGSSPGIALQYVFNVSQNPLPPP